MTINKNTAFSAGVVALLLGGMATHVTSTMMTRHRLDTFQAQLKSVVTVQWMQVWVDDARKLNSGTMINFPNPMETQVKVRGLGGGIRVETLPLATMAYDQEQ